ncbi:bifunctional methionine sulfoxide reductase B/A protein [Shewanella maritima]|uniref:Peptide methionine sulfoxide reductase MsrA n=1 Tax=Shewanella maritima TaxID=2520507 RepID=A0A411PD66_9GAMM|nr:bifunctional methionine sulfoxide reductase B/A protein [Shewanella maritima]QBF81493.1 bifunctional methionine sulfoxide reductase B/A protein [Shewanella maritima]
MKPLTEFERYVIEQKGTERPFTGEYVDHNAKGVYCCRRCEAPLYLSEHKFQAHCGWPAFDNEIKGAVTRVPDADGHRTEIVCAECGGHLGHVFEGEMLTPANVRHCVNSVSMTFKEIEASEIGNEAKQSTKLATFGGGCFWCLEAIFSRLDGVEKVTSGYSGGSAEDANYEKVCSGNTHHAEVVQVEFDATKLDYQTLLAVFFSSHDPTTLNRQGNDVGPQYRSVIFVHDQVQADLVNAALAELESKQVFNNPVVTQVVKFDEFYAAELKHENYYANNPQQSYCQMVVKPKVDKVTELFQHLLK